MTDQSDSGTRLLGSLRSAGGAGVVRVEERFDTGIDDLWQALTVPDRLALWWGEVEGDLRLGGEFRLSSDWYGTGRVVACEAPRLLRIRIRESDESYKSGQGVPPFDENLEARLTAEGGRTVLVVETAGMPLDVVAFYGVGWQVHLENLAAHLAGRERGDTEARWGELIPPYQALAAGLVQ